MPKLTPKTLNLSEDERTQIQRNDEAADRQMRASLQFRAMERSSLQAGTSDTMRWTAIR